MTPRQAFLCCLAATVTAAGFTLWAAAALDGMGLGIALSLLASAACLIPVMGKR